MEPMQSHPKLVKTGRTWEPPGPLAFLALTAGVCLLSLLQEIPRSVIIKYFDDLAGLSTRLGRATAAVRLR
jgi:hypothetical protein